MLGVLGFAAVVLAGIPRLTFDSSVESLSVPDNPARLFQQRVSEMFGQEEVGVVVLAVDGDIYRPPVIEALRDLDSALSRISGISHTLSLSNVADLAADVFTPPPMLSRGPVTPASVRALKERVMANPLYVPNLVATDAGAAAINVFFDAYLAPDDYERLDDEISAVLEGYQGPGELFYAGMSHVRVRAVRMMQRDLSRFSPISLAAMMVVLWLNFGSVRAVVLPLFVIALGVGLLVGLMGWLGAPITMTTLVLPSLLLVIGGSYAVHVIAALLREGGGGDTGDVFARVRARVGLPVAVSALTTATGFGSLAIHPIPAISGLGFYAVVGIAIVAATSLFVLPLAFGCVPGREAMGFKSGWARPSLGPPQRRGEGAGFAAGYLVWLDRLLQRVGAFAIDHRRVVFLIAGLAVAVSVAGSLRLRVNTDFLKVFRPDAEVRRQHEEVTRRLVGPNPVNIVISGPEPGYFKGIAKLRQVREFQEFLEESEDVDTTVSLVDYLTELDLGLQASGGGLTVNEKGEVVEVEPPPSFWKAPREQLPQVFELVSINRETFSPLVDADFSILNVTARTSLTGSMDTARLLDEIDGYARVMFPRGVEVRATGNLVVMSETADRVISGQVESVALAFAVILAALALLFLSLRVGFAAMIPNVVPLVVFFGVMGWFDIELNLATSIIAAVALGISVDDTIHYMARLNRAVKSAPGQRDALLETLRTVGPAVVATSLTLTAGFIVMVLSGFSVIANFGALSAITMMVALVTNVVLLPAILATVPVISIWDLVAFRLGPSPHRTIDLFRGLGPLSVRLLVLMGELRSFAAGEELVRSGEPGEEMFLVLSGEAEVLLAETNQRRSIARLGRGDVFGEMALLRKTLRTADVAACSDVELLVIDEDFLRRLRRRYPRFASIFFINIARILSDRLEEANRRGD